MAVPIGIPSNIMYKYTLIKIKPHLLRNSIPMATSMLNKIQKVAANTNSFEVGVPVPTKEGEPSEKNVVQNR